ncbi:MAG: fumarylacetoacetate hydrolase family protein [Xanthomonadales bacterium]|nr:fumarylacetoacetate hydrolase family protein [Xanthomonadales bacterium]
MSLFDAVNSPLPQDAETALLVGRVWCAEAEGPTPIAVIGSVVYDISRLAPTVSQLFELPDLAVQLRSFKGKKLGAAVEIFAAPDWQEPAAEQKPTFKLLTPIDLQCIKACGVTFAVSVMERVVEEHAAGDWQLAEKIRAQLKESFGDRLANVEPGSAKAAEIKQQLIAEGLWSQYLEVAIGPDAEVFTKAPTLSAMGWGDWIGIREDSAWNNPEPEMVLVCNSQARIIGAALGNDVNLRDFEGRSALLLGKGKDNNASASIGPFIRVFDGDFDLDSVRRAKVSLQLQGEDSFEFREESSMELMTRDAEDLVAQTCGRDHQYPDGFALYLGSLIAPTQDRGEPGKGFTHASGDVVTVASAQLGSLVNKVTWSAKAPPWQFGITALMSNLAKRGLLGQ